MTSLVQDICSVPDIGVLHCTGPDTLAFLQSQLTNDFARLRHDQARLAAYLDPKGRMQASFLAVRFGPQDVLLLTHASVLETVQKRLSMFILRAKVRILDATAEWQLRGLLGYDTAQTNDSPLQPWQVVASDAAVSAEVPSGSAVAPRWIIGLYPADGQARALLLGPSHALPPADTDARHWAWAEVRSGIATISAPVAGTFVPQMLNYESVDGVSFSKGCYPGQEVVARSQFRGAIKRRAYIASGHGDTIPAPGADIYCVDDLDQPCGTVAQSAAAPERIGASNQRFDAIVSIKTAIAQHALLARVGDKPVPLSIKPAPYPLREDI